MCRIRVTREWNDHPVGLTAFRREQVRIYPSPVTNGAATSDGFCYDQDSGGIDFGYPASTESYLDGEELTLED